MSMNFPGGNKAQSFRRQGAFPLDAYSYFESYKDAADAALTAEAAGGTNSQYYFGQTIVVVENDIATLYMITPSKQLERIKEVSLDETLSTESTNAVQNKIIAAKFNEVNEAINEVNKAINTKQDKLTSNHNIMYGITFIGTGEEYKAANAAGEIPEGAIIIITDDDLPTTDETRAVLGTAILGTMTLGQS